MYGPSMRSMHAGIDWKTWKAPTGLQQSLGKLLLMLSNAGKARREYSIHDSTVWVATMAAAASKLPSIPHQMFHGWLLAFPAS